jgi:hypothetical protein
VNTWKQILLEKGPEIFAQDSIVAEYERRIAELERLIGKGEIGIALLKSFRLMSRMGARYGIIPSMDFPTVDLFDDDLGAVWLLKYFHQGECGVSTAEEAWRRHVCSAKPRRAS